MRDHGGNIDWAMRTYGGAPESWIDLSTGINRVPYPVPRLTPDAWRQLPTRAAIASLKDAARRAWAIAGDVLPVAGAQAAIQMIPRLGPTGTARVLAPTYNEHAAALRAAGWQVQDVATFDALAGADLAVVVNPNNPDGRTSTPADLLRLAGQVGRLIVDESFGDPRPDLSLAPLPPRPGLHILRSFGKFYGLAGLRLGFVLGHADDIAALSEMAGPWPVSGAAIEVGRAALADDAWARATIQRLRAEADQMDDLARAAGWRPLGGCELFRLYDTESAQAAQDRLAERQIWSRIFPYSTRWIRLGLPGSAEEWARFAAALRA